MDWYSQDIEGVYEELGTSGNGLSPEEAEERLNEHGDNSIESGETVSPLSILLEQFNDFLIWVLLAAAGLSFWAGHTIDTVLIAIIVAADGVFGFVQDYKAEKSIEALKKMASPSATVIRNGEHKEISSIEVVPGDVVVLEQGDSVPADARIIESNELKADESALTGESIPIPKNIGALEQNQPLAERSNMVFKQTNVARGRGKAVVVETGMDTQVGGIARELEETEDRETPFQKEVDQLGKKLGAGIFILSGLIVPILVLLKDKPIVDAALTAISLAVAAVPEGLPAVVTLTLALGVKMMASEDALIRRLPVVESLGSVDIICSDKTGTMTEGEMEVTQLWSYDEIAKMDEMEEDKVVEKMFEIGAVCNNAMGDHGDPTELALIRSAEEYGLDVEQLREKLPREKEIGFTSERKRMTTVHEDRTYMKGAPEVVLERCGRILTRDGIQKIDEDKRQRVHQINEEFASDALRVLGFAYKEGTSEPEEDLIFVGLQGMIDPPRQEVRGAIEQVESAGIRVKMITGDNSITANAIGEQLGIESKVLEGSEIEEMSDKELQQKVDEVDVYARVAPEHKVRILEALQSNGNIVAMTGDGVNDAPALKDSDVGIAMGQRGTDVAKQSSDMILLDDNFATIKDAVRRGRTIFDNIWKFVTYLLSANLAEVLIVFIASLYGYLILPAVQLLWVNLLTDGLPALALGADPESGDVMDRKPREQDAGIIDREMLAFIGGVGVEVAVLLLGLMIYTLEGAPEVTSYAMTMVFTGLVMFEFQKLYVVRWLKDTPMLSNKWLIAAVATSLLLHLSILYTPLRQFFGTVPLSLQDWIVLGTVLGAGVPVSLGIAKLVKLKYS